MQNVTDCKQKTFQWNKSNNDFQWVGLNVVEGNQKRYETRIGYGFDSDLGDHTNAGPIISNIVSKL